MKITVTAFSTGKKEGQLARDYFFELYRPKMGEDIKLHHYEASVLDRVTLNMFYRAFEPNIHKNQADQVLDKQWELNQEYAEPQHLDQTGVDAYINNTIKSLNNHTMNTENLSYLQKQLLNMGFGEKLNDELGKKIKSKEKEFSLDTTQTYNKDDVNYTLHYKAGDQNDMYFFNRYEAKHKENEHTFYINKGSGITAKEAYNLLEGRSVHKQLENLEGDKYGAWIVIDKEHQNDNGQNKLRTFTDGWNYKPERAIDKMDIVGIGEGDNREKLLKSLEKGNRHQVSAMKDGKEVKLFIEANPAEHRINLTNWKGEAQQLDHYKKQELKNETKQGQNKAHKQEDAPAKKPKKSTGVKV